MENYRQEMREVLLEEFNGDSIPSKDEIVDTMCNAKNSVTKVCNDLIKLILTLSGSIQWLI